jgi:hypothetical protein
MREKEREIELKERDFRETRDGIQAEMDKLNDRREQYNWDQRQKELDAQADARRAGAALEIMREDRRVADEEAKGKVEAQQSVINATNHLQEVNARGLEKRVTDAKTNLDLEKVEWDLLITKKQEDIDKSREDAREFDASAKAQVKTAETEYKTLRDQIQQNIIKIGEQIQKYKDIAAEAKTSADKQVQELQRIQRELQNTWQWQNAVNNAVKNGVAVDPSTLPPGVTVPPPANSEIQGPPAPPPPGQRTPTPPRPPGGPQPPTLPPNPGGEGMGMGGEYGGMTAPVPKGTQESITGAPLSSSNAPITISGMQVSLNGINASMMLGPGDPKDERYWVPIGAAVFRGINTALETQHNIRIETTK